MNAASLASLWDRSALQELNQRRYGHVPALRPCAAPRRFRLAPSNDKIKRAVWRGTRPALQAALRGKFAFFYSEDDDAVQGRSEKTEMKNGLSTQYPIRDGCQIFPEGELDIVLHL
ncbi:uncharacterized protein Tco025E_09541 [Trypanosoma conorhini]|uniref:Uncharacterized protein n=1 Tax=Trypanosoma conorhini TaxID=83891 RepID=A0A3R7JUK5_9TRYP|nr:uncharacterized protein Tco025E_09541 [Trypanosoma conorhini]RNE97091.1 hypothetical protein Tco025E_09541 [Trypanosoma conorhini]